MNPQTNPLAGVLSYPLADGERGTEQTLRHIRALVEAGKKHPDVRAAAVRMIAAADPFNQHGYDEALRARAILEAVIREFRYVPDPTEKELLHPAHVLLQTRAGDCDDLNGVLLPSLLGSVGVPVRLVTISTFPDAPREFTHIYAEAQVNGRWLPMDAARRGAAWLRPPGQHFRRREWYLDGGFRDVKVGLAGYGATSYGPGGPAAQQPSFASGAPRPAPYGTGPRQRLRLGAMPRRRTIVMQRRVAGLGQGFDWGNLFQLINTGTASAAQLIAATKGPGGGGFIPGATGGSYAPAPPATDYTPLLIGGGLLLAVMMMRRQ